MHHLCFVDFKEWFFWPVKFCGGVSNHWQKTRKWWMDSIHHLVKLSGQFAINYKKKVNSVMWSIDHGLILMRPIPNIDIIPAKTKGTMPKSKVAVWNCFESSCQMNFSSLKLYLPTSRARYQIGLDIKRPKTTVTSEKQKLWVPCPGLRTAYGVGHPTKFNMEYQVSHG
jgi:hypothetical protein